jgi:hypothetical protein
MEIPSLELAFCENFEFFGCGANCLEISTSGTLQLVFISLIFWGYCTFFLNFRLTGIRALFGETSLLGSGAI